MERRLTRRQFVGAIGLAGLLWRVPLPRSGTAAAPVAQESGRTRLVHLSDFHWGYRGEWNRSIDGTFQRALDQAKSLSPDLLVVTGDLIQACHTAAERERRLDAVKTRLDAIEVPWMAVPGEHDTFGDMGRAFEHRIGPLYFHRVFRGLHVFGLDNVSRGYYLGRGQLSWLSAETRRLGNDARLLVLSHAPLFSLFGPWNWSTFDGPQAYALMAGFRLRHFLFGHIHQALNRRAYGTMNYAGLPTSWPLPEPGSLVRLEPWPQGGTNPDMGLGLRVIDIDSRGFSDGQVPLAQAAPRVERP